MPVRPGLAQIGKRAGDVVGVADQRQAAHAVRVAGALLSEFLHRHGLRRDVLHRQDEVDGVPVGALDDAVVLLLGLLLRRPAGDDADRVDSRSRGLARALASLARARTLLLRSPRATCARPAVKNASQLRIANAWPSREAPAFMITGPRCRRTASACRARLASGSICRRSRNRRGRSRSA